MASPCRSHYFIPHFAKNSIPSYNILTTWNLSTRLQGLRECSNHDRRHRAAAPHPEGTVQTRTSGRPRPSGTCSLERGASGLKSARRSKECLLVPTMCTRAPHNWPSDRVNTGAKPAFPATCRSNSVIPSSVRTTWRGRPALLARTLTVPASGPKSPTRKPTISPYRHPVKSAHCTSVRKTGSQPLTSRCASA